MNENLSLLSQLIHLSKADGIIGEDEYQLMTRMAESIGLSKKDVDSLMDSDERPAEIPKSEFDRILQFNRLVLLMHVDQDIAEDELATLREFGLHLKLRPEAIESVLQEMKKHPNGMVPTQTMIQIFQRYHN